MIFLTATSETLTSTTSGARSVDWAVAWIDGNDSGATPGTAQGNTTTAVTTTIVSAPAASTQRQIKYMSFVNREAVNSQGIYVNKVDGSGSRQLIGQVTLLAGETLLYLDSVGWLHLDVNGRSTNVSLPDGDYGDVIVSSAGTVMTVDNGTGLVSGSPGFRNIPQNSQSANYTTVAADSGKHILHPAADANARTFTIDSNANVAYPVGTAITFINETSQVLSIAITSDTLTLGGSTTTGTRSLAQNGVATAVKVTSTKWIISGTGLT
jgi:hypothetical protein